MIDINRLASIADRFEGLEVRGGTVVVRPPADARGSTAVIATFESSADAKKFIELCEALPALQKAAEHEPAVQA